MPLRVARIVAVTAGYVLLTAALFRSGVEPVAPWWVALTVAAGAAAYSSAAPVVLAAAFVLCYALPSYLLNREQLEPAWQREGGPVLGIVTTAFFAGVIGVLSGIGVLIAGAVVSRGRR